MKKIMFSLVAVAALTLVSCGGNDYCGCMKDATKLAEEGKAEDATKKAADCAKMLEGKSAEEMTKMAADCK